MTKTKTVELRPEHERFQLLLNHLSELTPKYSDLLGIHVVDKQEFHKPNAETGGGYLTDHLPGPFPKGMSSVRHGVADRIKTGVRCEMYLNQWAKLREEFKKYQPLDTIDPGETHSRLHRINAVLDYKKSSKSYSAREKLTHAHHFVTVEMPKERFLLFFRDYMNSVDSRIKNLNLDENDQQYTTAEEFKQNLKKAESAFINADNLSDALNAIKISCGLAYAKVNQVLKKNRAASVSDYNRDEAPILCIILDGLRACLGLINLFLRVPGVAYDATLGQAIGGSGSIEHMKKKQYSAFFQTPAPKACQEMEKFLAEMDKNFNLEFNIEELQSEAYVSPFNDVGGVN